VRTIAFVALDTRVPSPDDTHHAAVTIRCAEVPMSQDWCGFGLLFFTLYDSRISMLTQLAEKLQVL
jgi:hypothetical protein